MTAGIAGLGLGYILSQFYRAFLAVLSPDLARDLDATAADLALASGLWFVAFGAMQIPVGILLDRIGPRRTAGWIFGLGAGGGAALLVVAANPTVLIVATTLIGAGCAPVLMATLYIFARSRSAGALATLAGLTIGIGSAGNLAAAAPLALAVEAIGWRAAVALLAGLSAAIGLAILALVRDPPRAEPAGAGTGGFVDLLRIPMLWLMLPLLLVNYAPAAGIRGLWAGPYLSDVFALGGTGIGVVTFWMAVAMILGNLVYGPLDRLTGTRKWVIIVGNLAGAACLLALALLPGASLLFAGVMLAAIGFFGSSYPVMIAHARSFMPAHLLGRGMTLVNLVAVGGVGVFQVISGGLHGAISMRAGVTAAYPALFLFFGLLIVAASAIYAFTRDRTD